MLDKLTKPKNGFIKKPWGGYLVLEKDSSYWLKKLLIEKGGQLSLQSHKNRYEIWIVAQGKIRVQKGGAFFVLQKGEHLKINKKEKHRIYGLSNAVVLEIAFGQPREKDIIRYEDRYDRVRYGRVRYGRVRYGRVRYGRVRQINSQKIAK